MADQKVGDVVQLPLDTSEPAKIGRKLWRKQILPIGTSIQYDGGQLDFTQEFAAEIVQNFNDGAFESVPLMLADKDNQHNEFPENQRGEIIGLEMTDDGVNALIETDPRGTELLTHNPKMGISPRLFTDYKRGNDGKEFGTVLRHGAITLDPQVYGLGAWESVDLSASPGAKIIDLSNQVYAKKEDVMAGTQETVETPAVEETPAAEVETPAEETPASEQIDLTAVQGQARQAIDLANRAIAEKNEMADRLHAQEVESRLERLQTGDNAVPKSIIDLARPLVAKRESGVIDLTSADGTKTSKAVSEQVFELLETVRTIPMGEQGTIDLTSSQTDTDAALEALRQQFGS